MENVTVSFGFRGKLIVNHPNFCSHEAIFTGHIRSGTTTRKMENPWRSSNNIIHTVVDYLDV